MDSIQGWRQNSYRAFPRDSTRSVLKPPPGIFASPLVSHRRGNSPDCGLFQLNNGCAAQRDIVHNGSAIAKALDYSLKRWAALSRYLNDGVVPIDNDWAENQIRSWARGRKNWLFAGSVRSGKRAAAIMRMIQSARMYGHDQHGYLKDVLTRLPTQRASEIGRLLPHQWVAPSH